MIPISGVNTSAAHPLTTAEKVLGTSKVQRSEDKVQSRSAIPVKDEYIPKKKEEPSGRYWLGKDQDGQPKIYFDNPERAADAPEKQNGLPSAEVPEQDKAADAPEKQDGLSFAEDPEQDKAADAPKKKASDDKAESCTCNTDKVDREIEKLKKKQEELERQINSETDDTKVRELESKLAQVESELHQKDNDTYRRQHSTFS